ncbi:MAG: polyphosphate polymerase domain-containing protein [bacterium]|nr:polyphosphate polymerase domain-containing protein [bacterium]
MTNKPYRFEFKYWASRQDALSIERELGHFGMGPDTHSASTGGISWVTSLYFDSYEFKDYQEKSAGLIRRKKLRARIYEPYLDKSKTVWLEIKKKNDVRVSKIRLKLNRDEWESFMSRGVTALLALERAGLENDAKNEIAWNLINYSAKPKVVVQYKRKSFVVPSSNLRITFDTELKACKKSDLLYSGFMVDADLDDNIIIEIKSNSALPFWLGEIIKKYNLKKEAISKYARGVEAIFRYNSLPR